VVRIVVDGRCPRMICEHCGYAVEITFTEDLRGIADGVDALHNAVCSARLAQRILSGTPTVEVWRE
jgi:hypothetical protein